MSEAIHHRDHHRDRRRDHIRDALRPLRQAKRWSLAEVEKRTGIAAVVVGSYERGDRMPPVPTLIDLIEAYGARVVIVGPDEQVVSTTPCAGREHVTYVVVTPDGVEVERHDLVEAEILHKAMPGSRVGIRVDRIGVIQYSDGTS